MHVANAHDGTVGDALRPPAALRVPVRDSKRPEGPAVVFGASAWAAFLSGVR
ncbi:DUF397 domain-containing protein [Streptomyces sp. NPDC007346]|uniref:DUF397 domain-containing protein n=1 Tax=Streptomyces sp. NPDC007346 TaxID=3154682 RepID=UPI003453441F